MLPRKAKILATIGPASREIAQIEELIKRGLDAARINMSHGTHDDHRETINNIRQASKNLDQEVAIVLDLQGPKIRVDKLSEPIKLEAGKEYYLGTREKLKELKKIDESLKIPSVYKDLVKDAKLNCHILFDDGLMDAVVTEKTDEYVKIQVNTGGFLKSNKGINLPDVSVSAPSLTDKDQEDLMFGLKNGIDYVALSFVRTKEDILKVKYLLHSLKKDTPIISKIEKPEAIENIDDIIEVSNVIMIARGDMGVEVGNHLVPAVQKNIIQKCNDIGRPVITATQMLESMITNPRPTRAEASDVANAIWDGTDVVMLSGETASGKYPFRAVEMMNDIIIEAERKPKIRPLMRNTDLASISSSLQVAASLIAEKNSAKYILSLTQSGNSCLKMTRFRSKASVLGITNSLPIVRRMALYWGIQPYFFHHGDINDYDEIELEVIEELREKEMVTKGDKIVVTKGDGQYFNQNTSNSIRVEIVKNVSKSISKGGHDGIEEAPLKNNGKIILDTNICATCQNCISICPHDIYFFNHEKRETHINVNNSSKCTVDMECVRVCPTGAIEILQYK
ncbi:pyruvate kinase [Bacteriovoracaceae bacterium]|nr:pyruvate kinase [Bacteriovoracaceae bacterium]